MTFHSTALIPIQNFKFLSIFSLIVTTNFGKKPKLNSNNVVMGKDETKSLAKFLKPFPKEVTDIVWWLRDFVWLLYPQANELIYDNYNAVAFGWSPTDRVGHVFCNIAVGRTSHNIHFGFYWGSQLPDPKKMLLGQGNQYRYILVTDKEKFPKQYIIKLMKDAWMNSLSKVKDKTQIKEGFTIVKSVSEKKRGTPQKTSRKSAKDVRKRK